MYKTISSPETPTFSQFLHVANFILTTHGRPELTYGDARAWYEQYKCNESWALNAIRSKVKAAA